MAIDRILCTVLRGFSFVHSILTFIAISGICAQTRMFTTLSLVETLSFGRYTLLWILSVKDDLRSL